MIYGTKPPTPRSAAQVTAYLRKKLGLRKVYLVDMGKGQEYHFAGGITNRWHNPTVIGVIQLKQLTFEGWVSAFQTLRRWNEICPPKTIPNWK